MHRGAWVTNHIHLRTHCLYHNFNYCKRFAQSTTPLPEYAWVSRTFGTSFHNLWVISFPFYDNCIGPGITEYSYSCASIWTIYHLQIEFWLIPIIMRASAWSSSSPMNILSRLLWGRCSPPSRFSWCRCLTSVALHLPSCWFHMSW